MFVLERKQREKKVKGNFARRRSGDYVVPSAARFSRGAIEVGGSDNRGKLLVF